MNHIIFVSRKNFVGIKIVLLQDYFDFSLDLIQRLQSAKVIIDSLRELFSKLVFQFFEKVNVTVLANGFYSRNHGIIFFFEKFAEFCEDNVDSGSFVFGDIEIGI